MSDSEDFYSHPFAVDGFCVISEEVMAKNAETTAKYGGKNHYARMMRAAKQFRDAGMHPVYLYQPEQGGIWVVTEETHNKLLH